MNIINPATASVISTVQEDSREAIEVKHQKARIAQAAWSKLPLAERIDCIRRFRELLKDHIEALAGILTSEVGKPLAQSTGEIQGARSRIAFFLEHSERWLAEEVIDDSGYMTELIRYEPLGLVGNISAWNYPYLVGVNVFIPALIAGNAVLYKPSEYAALTGLKIEELMHLSGVPHDAFQCLIGGGETGEALLTLPLDGYFFTGSYQTGKYIYEKVAEKMVPCQLELGGKDPMYITEDNADIARAAETAAEGAFYNNGQSCCAVERIYVHEAVYDKFLEAFVTEVASFRVGDPKEAGTFIGPVTRKPQLAVLEEQVKDAIDNGAEIALGGSRLQRTGYYFEPTVIVNANHQMKVMMEESFGPIIGIQKVHTDAEAIRLMKDTNYGLTSAVVTDSRDRAEAILAEMDSGTVYWNCCDRVSASLPWSGRGHSGIGTTLSYQGIRAFVQPKAYHLRKD